MPAPKLSLVLALLLAQLSAAPSRAAAAEAVTLGGPFGLVDQDGRVRTEADFRGSHMLVYFGFTFCPDSCPSALLDIAQALDRFAEMAPDRAAQVVPLFITIDPERDTVEAMKAYAGNFHPRLVGLTGSPEAIRQVARHYGVFYRRAPGTTDDGYLMDHSSFIFLMGPEGEYVTHFEPDVTAEEIVEGLRRWVGVG